CMQGLEFPGTF
nr:immunoglobulin light chain junction region [Macaca mulatta]